jgi:hypothetical protein
MQLHVKLVTGSFYYPTRSSTYAGITDSTIGSQPIKVFCDEDVALFNGDEAQYRFVRKPTVTRPKKSEQLAQLIATIAFIFFGFSSHHSLSEIASGHSSEIVASNPTSGLEQSETVATNLPLINISGNNNTVTTDAGTDYYEIASSESNAWDVAAAVVGILPWIFMVL